MDTGTKVLCVIQDRWSLHVRNVFKAFFGYQPHQVVQWQATATDTGVLKIPLQFVKFLCVTLKLESGV
jgi:hypothetical protein